MRLKSIYLENFRNYKRLEVNTDSQLIVIVGDNASGKTNFIESIYFLAYLKSFRAPDNLLVSQQEDYFKISGELEHVLAGQESLNNAAEVVVQVNPTTRRGFKMDGQKTSRIHWNTFKAVLFVPNDLNLFIMGPAARRKYLNETLAQSNPAYAADLVSLDHVLKQRGALLLEIIQNRSSRDQLDFWDTQLSEIAVRISNTRRHFLDFIGDRFTNAFGKLTNLPGDFRLEYKGAPADYTPDLFMAKLREYQDAEIRSGQNLFGPHRDDFNIYKNNELNIYNSSRGELRAQILSMKLLQAEYLTTGQDKPLILLDDVFSELDESRRQLLLQNLSGYQIFVTTTDEHGAREAVPDATILKTSQNKLF